jgi:hypothetical protein
MKFKKFNIEYDKVKLLEIFTNSSKRQELEFMSAVDYTTDLMPCMDIFKRPLVDKEYGLSELVTATRMHIKPNNNGLILFPISGIITIKFEDDEILVNTPIAINGKTPQKFLPTVAPAIFFAIKIPSSILFDDAVNLLP